jgi:phosphoserine phosphatase
MLEIVGNPQVVNPDPLLRRIARQRGWQVMHLRPDAPIAQSA